MICHEAINALSLGLAWQASLRSLTSRLQPWTVLYLSAGRLQFSRSVATWSTTPTTEISTGARRPTTPVWHCQVGHVGMNDVRWNKWTKWFTWKEAQGIGVSLKPRLIHEIRYSSVRQWFLCVCVCVKIIDALMEIGRESGVSKWKITKWRALKNGDSFLRKMTWLSVISLYLPRRS